MKQFKKFYISIDKDLNVLKCNDVFLQYIGSDQIFNLDQIIPPQDVMQLRNAIFAVNPGSTGFTCFRVRTYIGKLNWMASNIEKSLAFDGPITLDMTDIQIMKSENISGTYDKMTGLLSKQAVIDYLHELIEDPESGSFYTFLMDIDHFKTVNDTFGHMRGDEVIIDVAHILQDCVGENGVVGRIGGDEFMLVLEKINTEAKLREILGKIKDTVRDKYHNYGDKLDITVSLGGALFPNNARDYDSLFMLADHMLYTAKIKGRNRYIIYQPQVHGIIGLNGKMVTPVEHLAMNSSKVRMIRDLMRDYLTGKSHTIREIIERVSKTYDIDYIYVIKKADYKSVAGIEKNVEKDKVIINPSETQLPILASENITAFFDANRMAVVNIHEIDKEKKADIYSFMDEKAFRSMVVCLLTTDDFDGYLTFISRKDSACRLSEASLADLVYITSLLEFSSDLK